MAQRSYTLRCSGIDAATKINRLASAHVPRSSRHTPLAALRIQSARSATSRCRVAHRHVGRALRVHVTCNASPIGRAVGLPGVPVAFHVGAALRDADLVLANRLVGRRAIGRRRALDGDAGAVHVARLAAITGVHLGQTQRQTLIGVRAARIRVVLRARRSSQNEQTDDDK